nr:MarR family transcriptional regulator [Actinomycetota bacterium]
MTRLVPRLDAEESAAWLSLVTMLELLPSALDSQLQREAGMTHFEFAVLSFLRFSPDQTLRMSELATGTNATLPRLSHVVSRLERRGVVERTPSPDDRR